MSERERFAKWLSGRWTPAFSSERQQAMCEGWNARAELAADEKREAAERERALVAEVERLRKRDVALLFSNEGELCDMSISWMARNGYETPELQTVARALAQHESKEASA